MARVYYLIKLQSRYSFFLIHSGEWRWCSTLFFFTTIQIDGDLSLEQNGCFLFVFGIPWLKGCTALPRYWWGSAPDKMVQDLLSVMETNKGKRVMHFVFFYFLKLYFFFNIKIGVFSAFINSWETFGAFALFWYLDFNELLSLYFIEKI